MVTNPRITTLHSRGVDRSIDPRARGVLARRTRRDDVSAFICLAARGDHGVRARRRCDARFFICSGRHRARSTTGARAVTARRGVGWTPRAF